MNMLRDQNLLGLVSTIEGYFYLIDISEESKLTVKLHIRIPHERISTFEVDEGMQ
jgi:hypothetical protein